MNYVTTIKQDLLQTRLDGVLKTPEQVMEIVRKYQPSGGLNYAEWTEVSNFILRIEKADNIPAAKVIAVEHQLNIGY